VLDVLVGAYADGPFSVLLLIESLVHAQRPISGFDGEVLCNVASLQVHFTAPQRAIGRSRACWVMQGGLVACGGSTAAFPSLAEGVQLTSSGHVEGCMSGLV
jgi:hypothetical protein